MDFEYVGYIFKIIFPNNKIYIGLTTKRVEVKYYGSGSKEYRKLLSYFGRDNLLKEELCYRSSLEELSERESYYIELFNSTNEDIGYNKCRSQHPRTLANNHIMVGEKNPMYGKRHSVESKAKMGIVSKKFIGEKNPMYGRTHLHKFD